jgi:hypothetical protein
MSFYHDVQSNPVPELLLPSSLKFLVAGLCRGGTNFVHTFFQELGRKAFHESIFATTGPRQDPHRWEGHSAPEIEVSGICAPYAYQVSARDIPVIHLLRDPVPCINSNLNYFPKVGAEGWEKMAGIYLHWHEWIAASSVAVVRLEHFFDDILPVLRLLHLSLDEPTIRSAFSRSRNVGRSTPGTLVTWDMLPHALKTFAKGYGYGPR